MRRTARGIPLKPILFTEDQVADMLDLSVARLRDTYIWRAGEERIPYRLHFLKSVMIEIPTKTHPRADWRIPEYELDRWLTFHNLYIYDPEAVHVESDVMLHGIAPLVVKPEVPSVDPALPPGEDLPDDDLLAF